MGKISCQKPQKVFGQGKLLFLKKAVFAKPSKIPEEFIAMTFRARRLGDPTHMERAIYDS
jgi:hypothetical protein